MTKNEDVHAGSPHGGRGMTLGEIARDEDRTAGLDTQDNWKERHSEMVCNTCVYFVPKADTGIGRCRRHAPTMNGWPVMYPTDWCGDHKLKAAAHG